MYARSPDVPVVGTTHASRTSCLSVAQDPSTISRPGVTMLVLPRPLFY